MRFTLVRKLCICAAVAALFCTGAMAEPIRVALSMSDLDTARSVALALDVCEKLDEAGMELCVESADGSVANQISDIRALLEQGPHYLLVNATQSVGLRSVLQEAAERNVRIILVEQMATDTPGDMILSRIGMDCEWAGAQCARILAEYFQGREAKILEIQGEAGNYTTNSISRGFRDALCQFDNLQLAGVLRESSSRELAESRILEFYKESGSGSFDAIFAHSDEGGLGAVNASLSIRNTQAPILSIGGQDDAIRALAAGKLYACVSVAPNYGERIVDCILKDRQGAFVEPLQWVRGELLYGGGTGGTEGY